MGTPPRRSRGKMFSPFMGRLPFARNSPMISRAQDVLQHTLDTVKSAGAYSFDRRSATKSRTRAALRSQGDARRKNDTRMAVAQGCHIPSASRYRVKERDRPLLSSTEDLR